MSATIRWVATERGKVLETSTPSNFIKAMERAFGSWPVQLDEKALPVLRGMAAIRDTFTDASTFDELIHVIEEVGGIRLWSES